MDKPDFSVITPSFNMLPYLKRCVASIADQNGVSVEHIVVDNLSQDGTIQWLNSNDKVSNIIEKDSGIYDAVNKGLKKARGEIYCHLNCDEQYLPGILSKVKIIFEENPSIDIVYGNTLVIDENNDLIAFRKTIKPRYYYILAHYLYIYTCSIFYRRKLIDNGLFYNSSYQYVGDALYITELLKKRYKFGKLNEYTSIFTLRENCGSMSNDSRDEQISIKNNLPPIIKILNPVMLLSRYIENLLSGSYFQNTPLEYNIYSNDNLKIRELKSNNQISPFIKNYLN